MGTMLKNKVVLKDVGNPKAVTMLPDGQTKLLLGTIIGIASGTVERKAADGLTTFTGLKGSFEAVPANADNDTVQGGVCFLPESFQGPIEDMLADDADSVKFAFEVYAVKADNPQGYSWAMQPLTEAAQNDPLAELRALAPASKAPAIEDKAAKK